MISVFKAEVTLLTEIFPPWETIIKHPMFLIESRESANNPTVYQCTYDCPPFHAFEAPQAEYEKTHQNACQAAYTIVSCFEAVYIDAEMG